jgi:hypothetical protein
MPFKRHPRRATEMVPENREKRLPNTRKIV